jgi:hypothetical protein
MSLSHQQIKRTLRYKYPHQSEEEIRESAAKIYQLQEQDLSGPRPSVSKEKAAK